MGSTSKWPSSEAIAEGLRRAGHDPVPDGRTGPFNRKRHLMVEGKPFVHAFDERCTYCREQARLSDADLEMKAMGGQ